MTLRIGIIGAGANTRLQHIPGFRSIPDVEITAVCNRSLTSSQRAAEELDIPHAFEDWKALVHSDSVDSVCIGTWPYMHCPISLEALSAGKHVLTEARMCMNLAEARQMQAAAVASDGVAMIVPAPMYLAAEPLLLKMLEDGFFGDLIEIEVRGLGGVYNPDTPLHWRQRRDFSGQNIMTLGILNETVRRYAGHEKHVLANSATFTAERVDSEYGSVRPVDVPDSLGVLAELENGAQVVYHLSSVARLGDGSTFEFYGTKGSFKMEGGSAIELGRVWIAGSDDASYRPLEVPELPRNAWRVEEDFIDAILQGRAVTHTHFDDGVRYMQFTEAVQVSLAEGRKVALDEL